MPKMTHPYDRGHVVDVADEKVAVYLAQGWGVKSDQGDKPVSSAVTRGAVDEPAPVKKAAAKRAAKKA